MGRRKKASIATKSAFRRDDQTDWLDSLPLPELYRLYMTSRTIVYYWFGNPTADQLSRMESEIPRISEIVDFEVARERLTRLHTLPQNRLGFVSLDQFMPELADLSKMAFDSIIRSDAPRIDKADAWLQAVANLHHGDADLEAAVYLASRGKKDLVDVQQIEHSWYNSICDDIVRGKPFTSSMMPAALIEKARNRTITLVEAADATRFNGDLPGFWSGRDEEEDFLAATMLRAADWFGIGGFDEWWRSSVRDLSSGPQGGLDPLPACWSLFHASRSDMLLRITERVGLESWLWTISNGVQERDRPWRLFWGEQKRPRMRDAIPIASAIAFMWERIQPQSFTRGVVHRAVDLVMQSECRSGGWPMWTDDTSPCLMSTCAAVHALAVNRPTGWEHPARRAVDWLWSQQEDIGCWTIGGGPTVWLTVLTLDSIELAQGGTRVTFSLQNLGKEKKSKNARAANRHTATDSVPDPEYDYTGVVWHNPSPPQMKAVSCEGLGKNAQIAVVLLTATKVELDQVLRLLRPLPRQRQILKVHASDETYYLGRLGAFRVALFRCMMGSEGPGGSTLATDAALKLWQPVALIMIGIAFGADRSKHQPGDVLVAEQIAPYEGQRVGKSQIVLRDPIPPTGNLLRNRFLNALNWRFERPDGTPVKAHSGRILSGSKLIDDPRFKQALLNKLPTAMGGEMEGAGLHAAAARNRTEWILVKAVCDWADGRKHDGYQELAAASAASLCQHVLNDPNALDGLERKTLSGQ